MGHSAELRVYKCPACGGAVSYDAASEKLACRWCGNDFDAEGLEATVVSGGLNGYLCPECGAELMSDDFIAATTCPYCGSNQVAPHRFEGDFKPDGIIPFSITRTQALKNYEQTLAEKELLPDDFATRSSIASVQGVYVPYWLFSGTVDFDFTFYWTDNRKDSDLWGYKRRVGTYEYTQVPADGSRRMPDDMMDSVEPFQFDALVPFSDEYLPGFVAERYTMEPDAVRERADLRAKNTSVRAVKETLDLDSWHSKLLEQKRSSAVATCDGIEQALLPVWLIVVRYRDQSILVGVNGQTGKVAANLPIDEQKQKRHLHKKGRFDFWMMFIIAAIIGFGGAFIVGLDLRGDVWMYGMEEIRTNPSLHRDFILSILKITGLVLLPFVAGAFNLLVYRPIYKAKMTNSMQNVREAQNAEAYGRGALNLTLEESKKGPIRDENNWPPLE